MTDEVKEWHEANKDKPQCSGHTYVGTGRGGAHWEDCTEKHNCPKYKCWIVTGRKVSNVDEQVNIHSMSLKMFRLCLLNHL